MDWIGVKSLGACFGERNTRAASFGASEDNNKSHLLSRSNDNELLCLRWRAAATSLGRDARAFPLI